MKRPFQLPRIREFIRKWKSIVLSCEPCDQEKVIEIIRHAYRHKQRPGIIFCDSPASYCVIRHMVGSTRDTQRCLRKKFQASCNSTFRSVYKSLQSVRLFRRINITTNECGTLASLLFSNMLNTLRSHPEPTNVGFFNAIYAKQRKFTNIYYDLHDLIEARLIFGASLRSIFPSIEKFRDAQYLVFSDYLHEVYGVKYPTGAFDFVELACHCSGYTVDPDIIIVQQNPSELHLNTQGQLHRDGGMCIKYRDGWGFWALNGVLVPKWLAETKSEEIDPRRMLKINNTQIRAEFMRKVGIERCWHKLATVIDRCGDYELGDLPLAGGMKGRYLKMLNASVPELWHVEGVGNECRTVKEALHWRKPQAMRRLLVQDDGEKWYQQGDVVIWPRDAESLRPFPEILT